MNNNTINDHDCVITFDKIHSENSLITYTQGHINTMIMNDLVKHDNDNNYYDNSPIMSHNGSGSDSGEELHSNRILKKKKYFSHEDVEKYIDKYYSHNDNKYSSEIDILTTYVRGQKNIYIQSKTYTEYILNFLFFSSIGLTSIITIITPYYCVYEWNSILVTSMNAIIILFLSLINYLKLESNSEKYLQLSIVFDTIETSLEVTNSKLIFIDNENDKSNVLLNKLKYFENKIIKNKNKNIILIPETIKNLFPIICNINIFSFIKKTESYKKKLIKKVKNIKNETHLISYKIKKYTYNEHDTSKENSRLQYLYEMKHKIIEEIVILRSIYGVIDDLFSMEIKESEKNSFLYLFFYNKHILTKSYLRDIDPIILKHFIAIGLINNIT
jgi:heme/copper-type cytochrome/quinol oxidase subunit 4